MANAEKKQKGNFKQLNFCRHEFCIYFGVYIAYLMYGVYTLLQLRGVLQQNSGFSRDPYNYELDIFNDYLRRNWHWYLFHAIATTVARLFLTASTMSIVFACLSVPSLLSIFPLKMLSYLLAMLIIFYLVAYIGSKKIIWLVTALWVAVMNILAFYIKSPFEEEQTIFYMLSVILFWTLLRCCSFAHFFLGHKHKEKTFWEPITLTHFLGYTLYFPTLANGPFLDYKRYIVMPDVEKQPTGPYRKLSHFGYELLRVLFWWLCLELGMRYLFVHYIAMVPNMAKLVKSPFGRHAIGYFLGQFFFLTYLVKYGLGIAFARYDGMQPPRKPQCIGHIHYYSNMWKHFDEGLYEFLFDYIYHPLVQAGYTKFVSTVLTFAFIFMWHGCQTDILIWTVMNFLCLITEKCLKCAVCSEFYKGWFEKKLGQQLSQRFNAIIFSQLFIVAAFSNVFFIGSTEMGVSLMINAYGNGFINYLALSFCCYCFFQCSELISINQNDEGIGKKNESYTVKNITKID
ncbi:protein-cysteine N-palmitoyltransferase Rasp [Eurosta solidaginis]|uniref:protein-cysteine N-palmitoyltransferase Rasp n=1 Tax=Eurosta solidaginis TaxID=178769 RepID=UPI0035306D20